MDRCDSEPSNAGARDLPTGQPSNNATLRCLVATPAVETPFFDAPFSDPRPVRGGCVSDSLRMSFTNPSICYPGGTPHSTLIRTSEESLASPPEALIGVSCLLD